VVCVVDKIGGIERGACVMHISVRGNIPRLRRKWSRPPPKRYARLEVYGDKWRSNG
jgi:hypothetical protein